MDINLIGFDVSVGQKKPRTLLDSDTPCPFCDVANLKNIIDTDGTVILLRNKYNVIEGAEQFVIIESDLCSGDMPDYSPAHMRRLVAFSLKHWQNMLASGQYETVLFFKNYGPLSGGTIRHPHMQLVGFKHLNKDLLFEPREFEGVTIAEKNGVCLNAATCPRIGFGELNIIPERDFDIGTLAEFIQISVRYILHHFNKNCHSYNIFFYDNGDCGQKFLVKILPRFATSPLFIGYNIHFLPNNVNIIVKDLQAMIDSANG